MPEELTPAMMVKILDQFEALDNQVYDSQIQVVSQEMGGTRMTPNEIKAAMLGLRDSKYQRETWIKTIRVMLMEGYRNDRKRRFLELLFADLIRGTGVPELQFEWPTEDGVELVVDIFKNSGPERWVRLTLKESERGESTGSSESSDTDGSETQELQRPGVPDVDGVSEG
jgi:hypothetical protein